MPQGTIEDKDDMFIEKLNTAFLLFIGILAVFASVILLVYSASVIFYTQQFPMNFSNTSIFAGLLFIIGLGSLHLFQKRRKLRKKKSEELF